MVNSENIHTRKSIWTELVIFRNVYLSWIVSWFDFFSDGLSPGSVSWNKHFPHQVALVMLFYHSVETLTKTRWSHYSGHSRGRLDRVAGAGRGLWKGFGTLRKKSHWVLRAQWAVVWEPGREDCWEQGRGRRPGLWGCRGKQRLYQAFLCKESVVLVSWGSRLSCD